MIDISSDLPRGVRERLAKPPRAGQGVNRWLFGTAGILHHYCEEGDIIDLLREATEGCGRPIKRGEIERAIVRTRPDGGDGPLPIQYAPPAPPWPELDRERVAEITAKAFSANDLWEQSPVRFLTGEPQTLEVINTLFLGDPLLCAGWSNAKFGTRSRSIWGAQLEGMQFIVPSPMSAQYGRRKEDGKLSEHTLDNTGPRRFIVIEFDQGSADEQAGLLWHLATGDNGAPLALVVHSGGKSLHGWFYCAGHDEKQIRPFMQYAVSLGADPHTWVRSQFVRMPDGVRENGKRQGVIYFNPAIIE